MSRFDCSAIGCCALVACLSALQLNAGPTAAEESPPADEQSLAKDDPRRDLQITLETDKTEYFLGENILLHYTIHNLGKQDFFVNHFDLEKNKSPFAISLGGDSRNSAGRSLRFKIELIDQDGRKAEDPWPNPMCFGGMAGMPTLKPGDQWRESLPLMRYREPAKAGTYTVRVYHDLG